MSGASMGRWLAAYEAGGEKALVHPDGRGRPKGTKKAVPQPVKKAVMDTKEEFPFFGVRRIQSWCERAFGLGVSRQAVQETLAEAGIAPQKKRKKPRAKKVRFFERAKPMQMWQSDITQFVCPRTGKRVFLCVFLDDRSRYVVGGSVSARQTTEMVLFSPESKSSSKALYTFPTPFISKFESSGVKARLDAGKARGRKRRGSRPPRVHREGPAEPRRPGAESVASDRGPPGAGARR